MPFILRRFRLSPSTLPQTLSWSTPDGLLVKVAAKKPPRVPPQRRVDRAEGSVASLDEGDEGHEGHEGHEHRHGESSAQTRRRVPFPPTSEQVDDDIDAFIASIDKGAVCRLASLYNCHRPCSITGRSNGSFNVCFFVRFDDTTQWVVRIPLEPMVEDSWTKVQSEVATMRHVKLKTSVPVPAVHAYGRSTELRSCSVTVFMISDLVPGHSLRFDHLRKAPEERRTRFLNDMVDILVELRRLEFPAAGSLMPNPANDDAEPIVGDFMDIAINELQRESGSNKRIQPFTSAEDFINYQYSILSDYYATPFINLAEMTVQQHLFALNSLAQQIPCLLNPQWSKGPFILSHLDLRCSNIIVDDHLHIIGIIDWEFTGTVPLQFFTPPLWITGQARAGIFFPWHDPIFQSFEAVLQAKSITTEACAKLVQEWNWSNQQNLMFPIVQILLHPDTLLHVYQSHLCDHFFKGLSNNLRELAADFFANDVKAKELATEVDRRMEASKRYKAYLTENDLLVVDEEAERREAAFVAKLKQGIAKFEAIKAARAERAAKEAAEPSGADYQD